MAIVSPATPPGVGRGYRIAFLIALIVAPLLVVLTSGLLFASLVSVASMRGEVEESYRTREQIQRVFSLLQDAETGQRGFIVTGQESFLEPYHSGVGALDAQLASLDGLLADEPDQLRRMKLLRQEVDLRLKLLAQGIEARRIDAGSGAEFVASGRGKAAMDEIRRTVREMIRTESMRLDHRTAQVRVRSLHTRIMAGVVSVLLLASLMLAAWLVHRHTQSRQILMERIEQERARQLGIFESTMDAIVTLNPSGSIETINRAAEMMFGYDREQLVRRDASLLVDLAPGEGLFLQRLALKGDPELGLARQYTGRRKDGTTFPVEIALGALRMRDGVHVVAAVRDITERKEAERLKDEFVSTVSHELRTPLTSIAGSLGLLDAGAAGPLPEKSARLVHIAKVSCDRLVRLINDLLDVQKIASGQVRFDMRPMDLRQAAGRAVEGMSGFADERQVRVAFAAPPEPLMVNGDADRLIQVLNNLLSNAVKFSPAGGTVTLSLERGHSGVNARVSDQGPGVPENFQASLFRKFAQADGSSVRSVGGSGLGLAISREIAERHGGTLVLAQSSDAGATFQLSLPSAQLDEAGVGRVRLLVCEDDEALAGIVARGLEKDGFAVEIAPSIEVAENALRERPFDALLLDLHLPDGDGLSLARRLRADPALRGLPIVVMSGDDGGGIAGLPVADWIGKPVDIGRLREVVAGALGGKRPLTILHVDDDLDLAEVVRVALTGAGEVVAMNSLGAARAWLGRRRPDLVILDVGLPDGSGLDLLPLLGEEGGAPPVIIYSGQEVDAEVVGKVEAVLTKSRVSFDALAHTVRSLTRQQEPTA